MPLQTGTRIGVYEVQALLGTGGMGEVYRARDTKLGRDVALKILPDLFSSDPDRLARFEREARTLATLNHPNIAHVYGLEDSGSIHALVMELVDGDDLAHRIANGRVPVKTAVGIATQVADALEAAHAQQIIHRDLKPANIKVRADGKVKLLDFGIAKVFAVAQPDSETVISSGATETGQIIGTGPYMSPEQALGQPVDKRTDIWAFGCVLFEMLAGQPAFRGNTLSSTVSSILEKDVDWTALPRETPVAVRRVLRRCLVKDHDRRLADIADARLDFEEQATDTLDGSMTRSARSPWPGVAIAAVAGAIVAAGVMFYGVQPSPTTTAAHVTSLAMLPPPGEHLITGMRAVNISPDGSRIALATNRGLYLRALDGFELRRLVVDANIGAGNLTFSPDGSHIAIMGLSGIQSIDLTTGASTTLPVPRVNQAGVLGSMSWTDRGLVGAFGGGGIWLLRKGASTWEPLVQLDASEATSAAQLLPDGDHVLFTLLPLGDPRRTGQIVIQNIKSGARTVVADAGSDAVYFGNTYIVYVRNGVLLALPFDVNALKPTGDPVILVEGVRSANIVNATMQYGLSENGTLAYLPGQPMPAALAMDLVISDRTGQLEHLHLPPAPYETPRVSPDGRTIAVSTDDGTEASVWVRDLSGSSSIRRLTLDGRNRFPVWSAAGKRIAFQSDRDKDLAIFSQAADGGDAATRLTTPEAGTAHLPEFWSATHLFFSVVRGPSVSLWALSLADKRAAPVAGVSSTTPIAATLSPDGRWLAYNTAAAPRVHTTFVRPFPTTDAVYQVSQGDDGHHPVWSRDGRELIYIPGPRRLFAVKVQFTPSFSFSPPELLAPGGLMGPGDLPRNFDILPDGTHFIGREIAEDEASRAGAAQRIQVVTNLLEVIQRRRR